MKKIEAAVFQWGNRFMVVNGDKSKILPNYKRYKEYLKNNNLKSQYNET